MTIVSKPATPEYLANWDRIFGKRDEPAPETLRTGERPEGAIARMLQESRETFILGVDIGPGLSRE